MSTYQSGEIVQWVQAHERELLRIRHALHQNPELGHQEHETTQLIKDTLVRLGAELLPGQYQTGAAALIRGTGEGPFLGIRADIDALPIQEKTGLDFSSRRAGVSHACGHDIHTAALLGCVQYLSEHTADFSGRVMAVFQCAEECCDGAAAMLEAGLFQRETPDFLLGFHCAPSLPLNTAGVCQGPSNASCDTVSIRIKGRGGHGAHPEDCVDPIVIAAYMLTQLQTIISRERAPMQPSVLTFGSINGGSAPNVIPDEVVLQGTLRAFDQAAREHHKEAIQRIASQCGQAMNGTCTVTFTKGIPPLVNSQDGCELVVRAAAEVLGEEHVSQELTPSMGSDDFSCLLEACGGKGVQYLFGTRSPEIPNSGLGLHVGENIFPDAAVPMASAVLIQAALNYLKR